MSTQRALSAYRSAIRASKIAFNGDARMLQGARDAIRAGMAQESKQPVEERIAHLEEVAKFVRQNIAQGIPDETGRFTLNIHKDIELGDNDTIKGSKLDLGSLAGKGASKCCSSKD
ncbi:hypothetical protein BABINDRAFT_162676 [Babjeviella inositovora NRRL Y-12698]|uniref:Mitochondrial zinc maintenance protein 1, mitochondrial n=1 Tax=Babjeviella inositovora NRRL Y-12698 TaxID=984486 RepID=A0A1E3QN93_9ASCO|nr:uncharacterized protein BABINDRAFT_162676 [Babjeviella inositovora NRRL Y-12698]ODQ78457.1 hypothetical protein BABINDRAFT_162676 [Babjeviella inositovora NRRL Y-12698]